MRDRIERHTQDISELFYLSDWIKRKCAKCKEYFTQEDYRVYNANYYFCQDIDWIDFKHGETKGKIGVNIILIHRKCVKKEYYPE